LPDLAADSASATVRVVPLRAAEVGQPINAEQRTLKMTRTWQRKPLALEAIERGWKLQHGFRLRQEFPDRW
jgi:hypothetical protein